MNDWLLLIGITLTIFFISKFIRKKLKAGTKIIFSLVSFIMLMTVFIINGVTHGFTWIRVAVLFFFGLLWIVFLYYQIRKYKQATKMKE